MFGGFFFPQRGKKWQYHHSNRRANSGQQLSASAGAGGTSVPLHPTGPASWASQPYSQDVSGASRFAGMRNNRDSQDEAMLLVKDPPNHLNSSWFLLPTCSCLSCRAGSSLHPSSCLHWYFQGRGHQRTPRKHPKELSDVGRLPGSLTTPGRFLAP